MFREACRQNDHPRRMLRQSSQSAAWERRTTGTAAFQLLSQCETALFSAETNPLSHSSYWVPSPQEGCVSSAASLGPSHRVAPRSRVLMTGTLMTPEGAVAVRIRDISVVGAQIWAPSPVPSNCDAILKRGSFFAAARVMRSSESTVGLQFYRELSQKEFASAFQHKTATTAAVV